MSTEIIIQTLVDNFEKNGERITIPAQGWTGKTVSRFYNEAVHKMQREWTDNERMAMAYEAWVNNEIFFNLKS